MTTVKVSSKGQIVLPKDIRERFNIKPGDEVEILEFGREIVLVPIKRDVKLRGLIKFNKPLKELLREIKEEEKTLEDKE
ncbi:AbrB family transcriptional regulator [Thermococcus litoralis DSM 5473]|uniref:AbrB family transcriptional regulator n=1 Tax=Thermococcus litoralis (strain ATCC 51850 / DSM 5473 / JCM 8560 / NS-C) TaxID=523849 RepID=H3ZQ78_THELN|nr:AbrB/MazE/SpoVT family DNA-binding domain-containing protein [Thermococcus litoralis]EHR77872.1 AbrB family transcriptional regulator [Thermococcus litoralis DSM 5473]KUJ99781.1 MAG: SpoVT/AbrB family transcription regulator [Thermococcales archaeon 44_46]HIH71796.1 AbrB/MazE/SpoVT family DNA-binding domain-containing protein [Thermococcaceae archaeon]